MTTNSYTSAFIRLFGLLIAFSISACSPTVSSHGTFVQQDDLEQIKHGESTRENVVSILGSPILVSTVDDKIWYYIGRQTEQVSFFEPTLVKQEAVEIVFDDAGVVSNVKTMDVADAIDISPVDRETPTHGHEKTILTEVLGVLAKPTPKMPDMK